MDTEALASGGGDVRREGLGMKECMVISMPKEELSYPSPDPGAGVRVTSGDT
jgi:hypothetical protein